MLYLSLLIFHFENELHNTFSLYKPHFNFQFSWCYNSIWCYNWTRISNYNSL